MQHSVTFYWRHSCQMWYSQLPPVSRYCAKFRQSISDFPISGQSLIKEKCHNPRTKVILVWNLDQWLKLTTETKPHQKNCDVIVIFPIYGRFEAIRKPDLGHIVCKTIFINSNLLFFKNWTQNEKTSTTALTLLLWVKVLYLPKNTFFTKKY